MTTEISVVRVFTSAEGRFGNELGIAHSSDETRGREQQIAAELGFSETVFIDALDSDPHRGYSARIRIFTPASELPFAGHPSVGTAWWLAQQGSPVRTLEEKAGSVAVRYDDDLTWITGRAEWAPEFTWLQLPTPEDVDAVDSSRFTEGTHYVWSWRDEASGVLRSRMFSPELGVPEDEATGAAAVAITAQLGRDLAISQGAGSEIVTRHEGEWVHVGGRTVFDRVTHAG
jgi:predicted PhzF superfamily epimerase YddE/YHI9